MCMLTYVPMPNGYCLTHNRDEHIDRQTAIIPKYYSHNGVQLLYPLDPQSNGTWMATNGTTCMAIINGGIEKHIPKAKYAISRGKIIIDFYENNWHESRPPVQYLEQLEPFTLIVVAPNNLKTFSWTGLEFIKKDFAPTQSQIWSSCTLYTDEIQKLRSNYFEIFLEKNPNANPSEIRDFHLTTDIGDTTQNPRMQRESGIYTKSIFQLHKNGHQIGSHYEELEPIFKLN